MRYRVHFFAPLRSDLCSRASSILCADQMICRNRPRITHLLAPNAVSDDGWNNLRSLMPRSQASAYVTFARNILAVGSFANVYQELPGESPGTSHWKNLVLVYGHLQFSGPVHKFASCKATFTWKYFGQYFTPVFVSQNQEQNQRKGIIKRFAPLTYFGSTPGFGSQILTKILPC